MPPNGVNCSLIVRQIDLNCELFRQTTEFESNLTRPTGSGTLIAAKLAMEMFILAPVLVEHGAASATDPNAILGTNFSFFWLVKFSCIKCAELKVSWSPELLPISESILLTSSPAYRVVRRKAWVRLKK